MNEQSYSKIRYTILLIVMAIAVTDPALGLATEDVSIKNALEKTENGFASTKIHRYSVNRDSHLEIVNKYGDIHIETWEKDSLKVVATITAETKSNEKAERMMDNVDFEIVDVGTYIVIKTVMTGSAFDLIEEIKGIFSQNQSNSLTIDYNIWMPAWLDISMENKFGNIYFPTLDGKTEITLAYGKILGNEISKEGNFDLKYVDMRLKSLEKGSLELNSSDLQVDMCGSLVVNSRTSTLNFNEVTDALITSNHDDIKVSKAQVLDIRGEFTDAEVWGVQSGLYLNARYCNVSVYMADEGFKTFNLQTEFSTLTINILDENACFKTEIVHHQGRLMYPVDKTKLIEEPINKKEELYQTSGTYGHCKEPKKHVSIKMKEGELKILSR